jgi:7,8-dihydro-6-hydroxymethylpterin dimethyltransferase
VSYMTKEEIAAYEAYSLPDDGLSPMERARRRMERNGLWSDRQHHGRRWAIGCVALEITQRCNLDCTLCYLSEASEATKDLPIAEVFRRIDTIHQMYGDNCDIQVTGGDPTLRKRDELVAIVRRIREKGMRPSLFTNGIKATRDLLEELSAAGLVDVAFHVDMTQQRRGYASEVELNKVRLDYIERARGLPIQVMFNTTAYNGNFHEIPDIVRFFVEHSDVVRLCSFQLQADTGRGIAGERQVVINQDTVQAQIEAGAGTKIGFGIAGVGHPGCNRYAMTLVANGNVHDLFDDEEFITRFLADSADLQFDRTQRRHALETLASWLVKHPGVLLEGTGWAAKKLWKMRRDLLAAKGKVGKLSFFIHNFMDACRLEKDRVDACVFMVATVDGPMSMCLHNAKRDHMLLKPQKAGAKFWDPVSGKLTDAPVFHERVPDNVRIPMKGRVKQAWKEARR